MVNSKLIDLRNYRTEIPALIEKIQQVAFLGIDTEEEDSARHDGLNAIGKYKDGRLGGTGKLVFDINRWVMTGFSLYPEGDDTAYYINLNHADVENRLPWKEAVKLLEAINPDTVLIAHNAPFELCCFETCYGYKLPQAVCTLQMAVSAFGPDEYPISDFINAGQGGINTLVPALIREASTWEPGSDMPSGLSEVVYKIIGKESSAAHSYNGFVKDIAYGYGLKQLVERFFKVKMTTYEEVLNGRRHMGELTGEDVVAYGADDAYWAVRLFRELMLYMVKNCPETIKTFFEQENPMIRHFADIWIGGLRVNTDAIYRQRDAERENMAATLRELKAAVRELLPFKQEPNAALAKTEAWYQKGAAKYRANITKWASSPDHDDAWTQCAQSRGPVSNAWAIERDVKEATGPNFSHYMPIRVLLYDLIGAKIIRSEGKVQSDGECRGKLLDRVDSEAAKKIIQALNKIASIEQRMKLYLTPYIHLMDPDTGKMYPIVSSMLASRRMAMKTPNGMQLAKRGESTYVRGFFLADYDDHVVISVDWSGIELVEIGEFSADPEFIKAFANIPHADLHSGAAADVLSVDVPGLTEAIFTDMKRMPSWEEFQARYKDDLTNFSRLATDLRGQPLAIDKAVKYWRTEIGKGSNFNYWFSGALGTVAERMGWSSDKMWLATERYRTRFSVAEQWRTDLIASGQEKGYVTLPDGHRRTRFEQTPYWKEYFLGAFQIPGERDDEVVRRYNAVIEFIARKIQTRANNQAVNSVIQGSCATIAKRSIERIIQAARARGWTNREFRFMMPIHDELVFSVHRSIAVEGIALIRGTMIDHPDLFKHCKLDASPSMGLTFEPYSKKAPLGQVELYELPKELGIGSPDIRATDDQVREVVDYLFSEERRMAA